MERLKPPEPGPQGGVIERSCHDAHAWPAPRRGVVAHAAVAVSHAVRRTDASRRRRGGSTTLGWPGGGEAGAGGGWGSRAVEGRSLAHERLVRYTRPVRPEDVARFARRDWEAVNACKTEQWLEERRRRGVSWCFRVADDLRRQVACQQPAWPTAAERQADLDTHVRVGEALRRVHRTRND